MVPMSMSHDDISVCVCVAGLGEGEENHTIDCAKGQNESRLEIKREVRRGQKVGV